MQEDYNRRVSAYLMANDAADAPRTDWHNRLDTDFMANPAHVSEAEFPAIAKLNNDAYKRRFAAEYEAISRTKGGKLRGELVSAYAEEMSEFAAKKRVLIVDMDKNPSLFNDPANRAKVMQMMAQEQKYISRIDSLDDFLRRQEGLLPRHRTSVAALGANRDPSNFANIRNAHAVGE